MSQIEIGRRAFLAVAAGLAGAARLGAQQGNFTLPPGPSGPIGIKADRPTLLMGDEAKIAGALQPGMVGNTCKRLQVRNWNTADDSFTWQVDAPAGGEFDVTALIKSKGAVLEFTCDGKKTERPVSTAWDRIDLGPLKLTKGLHEISLRAPQPAPNMEFYSLELIRPDLDRKMQKQVKDMRSDTSWMRKAKYGLQFHWTSMSAPRQGERKNYLEATRDFPAKEFAAMVNATGAGYVIITTSHAQHYFPAPIQAIDRIKPGRTAERDLVRDWIEALGAYNIKLILYYHMGHDDWRQPDGWWRATGYDPKNPQKFLANWTAITTEVGQRYGKGLAGWFFDDGCAYYPLNPDFRSLTAAAKTGNPNRVVCYNPWVLPRMTDFQDYLCGEGYEFLKFRDGLPADGTGIYTSGPHKGLQAHTNFILEGDWPHSRLNTPIRPPRYPKDQFIADMKGGIAHGVVPSVNLEIYQDGGIGEASAALMAVLGQEIEG
ncbi:MAG: alpha-L-fucosidase [Acidobacteriia bacterium]|nr:alpha-L-fucosidase [Terriglobia bacterium]